MKNEITERGHKGSSFFGLVEWWGRVLSSLFVSWLRKASCGMLARYQMLLFLYMKESYLLALEYTGLKGIFRYGFLQCAYKSRVPINSEH